MATKKALVLYSGQIEELRSADQIIDISNKVDKVAGKDLSTNDYDNTEKANVAKAMLNIQLSKDYTGFDNPDLVEVDYDSTARTVTVTTNGAKLYYQGTEVAIGATHTSVEHGTDLGAYFYYHNGTSFVWSNTQWTFDIIQIALIQYKTAYKIGFRECHGFMPWLVHEECHFTIGTYLQSGADATAGSYVLNNTTATNKRPVFETANIKDEDLLSIIASVSSGSYCHSYLTGSAVKVYTTDQIDFIVQNGTIPQYNLNTGGTWSTVDFTSNNDYGAVFVMATPVTGDVDSQKYRYLFVQPQTVSASITTIQALTPNNLTHGEAAALLSEFVFVGKIIVRRDSTTWSIVSVEKLIGNKVSQVALIGGGGYLSQVNHDETLTGDGSTVPLSVVPTSSGSSDISGILGETVVRGQLVYQKDSDSKWYLAKAVYNMVNNLSICTTGGDLDSVGKVSKFITISDLTGLTSGSKAYLSQSGAGAMIYSKPVSGYIAYIGTTRSTAIIDVNIDNVVYSDGLDEVFESSGRAIIDFGIGTDVVKHVITGTNNIKSTNKIFLSKEIVATENNSIDDVFIHSIELSAGSIVEGVGFTIYAKALDSTASGKFSILYNIVN